DRVGIVDHGRLLALDTPEALTRELTGQSVLDLVVLPSELDQPHALVAALEKLDGVERAEQVATGRELPAAVASGGPGGMAEMPGAAPAAPGFPAAAGPNGRDGAGPDLRIRFYLSTDPASLLGPVVAVLTERAASVSDVHIGRASLEDVFIDLTGRALR
ncbi:MAG: ABC transporter ATP-binding protein, partial [Actinomycetes bacterium]